MERAGSAKPRWSAGCRPQAATSQGARGLAAALILAFALAGCGSISERVAGTASESPLIGLPAGTPARPATAMPFPAVHDMPPARPNTVLSDAEQQKMEDDLVA